VSRSVQPRIKRSRLSTVTVPPPSPPSQTTALENMLKEFRQHGPGRSLGSSIGSNLETSIEALWANRTRSILTTLGILIGVAAVIAVLTLTQGIGAYITNIIGNGANLIVVFPSVSNAGGASGGSGSASTLTLQDEQTVAKLPHISVVTPVITTSDQIVFGNQNWTTSVEGVTSDEQIIQSWTLAKGSWFSSQDESQGTAVAVIGDTVYHNLFDATGQAPIGQEIRIRDQLFRVVGVLAPKGGGFSQDDVIYIPFKTAQIRMNNSIYISQIVALADSGKEVQPMQQAIESALRQNHHLAKGVDDDFQMFTAQQILQSVNTTEALITGLLVGIAAISLTVGGIGIMNIMLVSVTERTWEIGIRMAIGARRGDIRNQFLIEALLLCLIGGILGLGLGLFVGSIITRNGNLPFVVNALTITVPFAVSTAIALLFGLYPAIRASRLDPIVAIRSEE
jgi:putative ABC transport system permease protein